MFILDKTRKRVIVNKLSGIIPFQIIAHAKHEKALIIRWKDNFWMSIKKNKKIVLYPMRRQDGV